MGLAVLAATMADPAPASPPVPVVDSRPARPDRADEIEMPPSRMPEVGAFLDALNADRRITQLTGAWWQPAEAAMVAANPAKVEAARAFVRGWAEQERLMHRRMLAFALEGAADDIADPGLRGRERSRFERIAPLLAANTPREAPQFVQLRTESEADRARAAAAAVTQLRRLQIVARSPQAQRLWAEWSPGASACFLDRGVPGRAPDCAAQRSSPAVRAVRNLPDGPLLLRWLAATDVILRGQLAMAHAGGFRLHALLTPDLVAEAGLLLPPDRDLLSSQDPSP